MEEPGHVLQTLEFLFKAEVHPCHDPHKCDAYYERDAQQYENRYHLRSPFRSAYLRALMRVFSARM